MKLEDLADINPEALTADGFEGAIIGVTVNHHSPNVVVYDYGKCVEILAARGMSEEDACEHLSFNTLGAYVGKHGPIYMERFEQDDNDTRSSSVGGAPHAAIHGDDELPLDAGAPTKHHAASGRGHFLTDEEREAIERVAIHCADTSCIDTARTLWGLLGRVAPYSFGRET